MILINYIIHFVALQLGDEEILNADFGLFPTGSFSIPVAGITVTYNRSISGLDVAQIDGPLPEELFIRVSQWYIPSIVCDYYVTMLTDINY